MADDLRVGVLSPFLGGWYYGGVLAGVARKAAEFGATVVAVQTFDAGTDQVELSEPPDFPYPVAWQHVAGFIVLLQAVTPEYINRIRAAGKPVIAVSHIFADLDCPVVLPDNRAGVRDAVAHLIEHGHRAIAFAGYLGAHDIQQRYEAYCETLIEHGIEPDPELVFRSPDNQQGGGEQVALAMIAAGMPATALLAGTDANALGIMRVLGEAGYDVPKDCAVVGFDDLPSSAHSEPPLSTVRQQVELIGETAVEQLFNCMTGKDTASKHVVATMFVARESCGCPSRSHAVTVSDTRALFHDNTTLQAILSTHYEVSMELLRGYQSDPRRLDWLRRTPARAGSLAVWPSGEPPSDDRDWPVDIVGDYQRDAAGDGVVLPRRSIVSAFPAPEMLAMPVGRIGEVVFVVPLKGDAGNWGLLAVTDTVETGKTSYSGRESINQWAALLTVALEHQRLLEALRTREEQLRVAAVYDDLTGLPNRRLFLDRLRQAIKHAKRLPERRFAVLFMDLDGFKVVNDSLGHPAGDRLLVKAARRITASLRESDMAARFGGDEFIVLVESFSDPTVPARVAQRLQDALAKPFRLHGQDVVVSASIGITMSSSHHKTAEDILRDADIAMYWAKSREKGSRAVFDPGMHTRAVSRLFIETEMRRSIERDEFEVHYQPIVHMGTDRTHALEALIRWRHPRRGTVAPAEFLPVAEETGLIIPISRWMLDESCRRLAQWREIGGRTDLTLSVNVSDRQFWSPTLVDEIAERLRLIGLEPDCLSLEITEGVIMRDVHRARRMLERLHEMGCQLHIDDFGTGYSSLEALHQLPIDALKIDRSFVARLGVDPKSRELVHTIVLMGHNLGIDLIAEGVETQIQRELLLELGCIYGQGFLFSHPIPAVQVEEHLRAH